MGAFFSKHQYLVIWVSALAIIGALTLLVLQLNGDVLPTIVALTQPSPSPAPVAATQAAPSVTLTIQKTAQGNNLVIQWQNLPGDTTALNIFRSKKDTNEWQLWKTIQLNANQLFNGNALFNLGLNDAYNYSYYVQAVNGGGGSGDNSSSTQNILWTSSSTDPIVTTSTNLGDNGNGNNGDGSQNNNGGNGNSSSSQNNNNNNSSSSGQGGNGSGNNSSGTGSGSGPSGNPYYNPQIQITGYGTSTGNFWVQHSNQSIEIGWQSLPSSTDSITVTRSQDANGPWNQILAEKNPGTSGSYSLQLVDGTEGDPYYYEMTAFEGSTTLATYGPVYLAPQ